MINAGMNILLFNENKHLAVRFDALEKLRPEASARRGASGRGLTSRTSRLPTQP
jgi:hypothetical protein